MNLNRTMSMGDYVIERDFADQEDKEFLFEELKEAEAREVCFDDVLDEMTRIPKIKKDALMGNVNQDRRHFAFQLENAFVDAWERIATQRAKEAMSKAGRH